MQTLIHRVAYLSFFFLSVSDHSRTFITFHPLTRFFSSFCNVFFQKISRYSPSSPQHIRYFLAKILA